METALIEKTEQFTIKAGGMTFAALAWGSEDLPVVLALHGWLDNAASFTRLAPLLQGVRVIAIDMAGHGHSDHRGVGADYPLWAYVADVVAIADALELDKVHLLGHSMGAIVSVMAAATVPDRIASLTLIDGLLPFSSEPDQTIDQLSKAIAWRTRSERKSKTRFPSVDIAVKARMMAGFGKMTTEAAQIIVQRGLKEENGAWVWRSDSRLMAPTAQRMSREQSRLLVAAVKAPALLVVARDGFLDKAVKQFSQSLEHITIKALDGEHHLHLEDEAGDVARVIQPHLNAVTNNRMKL